MWRCGNLYRKTHSLACSSYLLRCRTSFYVNSACELKLHQNLKSLDSVDTIWWFLLISFAAEHFDVNAICVVVRWTMATEAGVFAEHTKFMQWQINRADAALQPVDTWTDRRTNICIEIYLRNLWITNVWKINLMELRSLIKTHSKQH